MEYNKQCRFRTLHHTRSQIDTSTRSYQHTTTWSCLIWNLHHTWSYRFRHLCCEEMGSYQVEKVLVMCWQDQTKHKSPSRVCSHCIVVPQNTCKKWQKWSRVGKDHVWRDHVWSPTPVYMGMNATSRRVRGILEPDNRSELPNSYVRAMYERLKWLNNNNWHIHICICATLTGPTSMGTCKHANPWTALSFKDQSRTVV